MAHLTKAEFAERCGITIKNLATYAGRGKVVYSPAKERRDERVNTEIEPNTSFLAKWSELKTIRSSDVPGKKLKVIRPLTKNEQSESVNSSDAEKNIDGDEEEVSVPSGLETRKLTRQIEKMEKEIERLTLSNNKARGHVVPIHLMDSVFLQERQSILAESKNTLQDILTIFSKKRDLTAYERSEISAEFTDRLNEMMTRAADATEKAVEGVVREFSIKKAPGERN